MDVGRLKLVFSSRQCFMDIPSPSTSQLRDCNDCLPMHEIANRDDKGTIIINSENNCSPPKVEIYPPGRFNGEVKPLNKCKKKTLTKKRVALDVSELPSSSSSPHSSMSSSHRGISVAHKRRNPRVLVRRSRGDVAAIGYPLGMSFAAVLAQVLYRRDAAAETMSPDHLSLMCMSAVRESLANVFGDKLDGLARNFEQSFGSTLNTLRLIYDSPIRKKGNNFNNMSMEIPTSECALDEGYCSRDVVIEDGHSDTVSHAEIQDNSNGYEEVKENFSLDPVIHDLTVHEQSNQMVCFSPFSSGSETNNSMITAFKKSVMEQSRSNDLKALELGLTMEKLKLKETQLALNYDLNHLERSKLAMGISKASFKAEKFKNQLEDQRHGELNKKCIDCLIAGLLVMSSSLMYSAYVYSYQRIAEATASCTPLTKEFNSWWTPKSVATFNSRLNVLWCQVQVMSRMAFGVSMVFAIAYLLIQRSTTSTQTMPVTLILLLLGVACGYCGKLCVDTLGGSGYVWLLYWEILCLLHFLSLVCTSTLFAILHGPLTTPQTVKGNIIFPYWIRRFLFYATLLVFLPLFCGLMPFASPHQWKDHFLLKASEYLIDSSD